MRILGAIFAFVGGFGFLVGGYFLHKSYLTRIGIEGFKICKETVFWPFFFNKKEWAILAIILGTGLLLMFVGGELIKRAS